MPVHELDDLVLVEQHVRAAGDIARHYFGGDYRRWSKNKGEPVTEADLAIDRYLNENLRNARPDYGWLSEEGGTDEGSAQGVRTFIVDPIDGTTAFLKGKPHFSISVAVTEGGVPRVGVVFNPIADECFAAAEHFGTRLNGDVVNVSDCPAIETCRILGAKDMFLHPAWSVLPNRPWLEMQIDQRSSVAYRMALVSAGTFDAALVLAAKHDWDMAAGDLIVREAGGRVTARDGSALRYDSCTHIQQSMVCAGPALHAQLLERLTHLNLPQR